jgi:hypothetical protein
LVSSGQRTRKPGAYYDPCNPSQPLTQQSRRNYGQGPYRLSIRSRLFPGAIKPFARIFCLFCICNESLSLADRLMYVRRIFSHAVLRQTTGASTFLDVKSLYHHFRTHWTCKDKKDARRLVWDNSAEFTCDLCLSAPAIDGDDDNDNMSEDRPV